MRVKSKHIIISIFLFITGSLLGGKKEACSVCFSSRAQHRPDYCLSFRFWYVVCSSVPCMLCMCLIPVFKCYKHSLYECNLSFMIISSFRIIKKLYFLSVMCWLFVGIDGLMFQASRDTPIKRRAVNSQSGGLAASVISRPSGFGSTPLNIADSLIASSPLPSQHCSRKKSNICIKILPFILH